MTTKKEQERKILQERGLRVTAPRLAVLRVLKSAKSPLSHSEVLECLAKTDWDPATVYRNLVKLRDTGIAIVVSRADGIDRYALALTDGDNRRHPHFVCDDCSHVSCLPDDLSHSLSTKGRWAASFRNATIQLCGKCPDCI